MHELINQTFIQSINQSVGGQPPSNQHTQCTQCMQCTQCTQCLRAAPTGCAVDIYSVHMGCCRHHSTATCSTHVGHSTTPESRVATGPAQPAQATLDLHFPFFPILMIGLVLEVFTPTSEMCCISPAFSVEPLTALEQPATFIFRRNHKVHETKHSEHTMPKASANLPHCPSTPPEPSKSRFAT